MSMVIICYASSVQQNDSLKNAGYHGEVKAVNIGINNNTGFYSRSGGAGINYENIVVTVVWGYNTHVHLISLATYENFAGLATGTCGYESVVLLTDNVTCINCAGLHVKGKSENSRLLTRFQSTYEEFRDLYAKKNAGVPENRIIFPLERNIFPLKDEFCESIKKGPTEFLEFIKKGLPLIPGLGYVNSAPYKTGAGRGNPKLSKATPDAESVFFVVRYISHSMAWYSQRLELIPLVAKANYHAAHNGAMCSYSAGLAPSTDTLNSTPRRQRMVTLAGQPQGWPVPFDAGISTPVNVTAPIERGNSSGDSLNQSKEAA
ncbi:ash family protein [Salmonella enterica subsp. diarizonae]|nr:ash family protein [Salmonella enterica subsp. diarizonae]